MRVVIRRLYIDNFRCLENFELPIAGRPSTLLIGKNGSGKSTVGSALEILQSIARGMNEVAYLVRPWDLARGRTDEPMRFEIEIDVAGQTYRYALEIDIRTNERCVREEKLEVGGKPVYSRASAPFVALPVIEAHSADDPLHIFRRWLTRMLVLRPIPSLIVGDSTKEELRPDPDASNLGDWFSGLLADSPAARTKIESYLKQVMPDFMGIQHWPVGADSRRLGVEFSKSETTLILPFKDLADGEKCFMICALVLAANDPAEPVFCFWDEPDNYLAPSEVGHFVMALRKGFHSKGQFLATSHNPEAIRQFPDENIFVLQRKNHLEPTLIRPLSDLDTYGDLTTALLLGDLELVDDERQPA